MRIRAWPSQLWRSLAYYRRRAFLESYVVKQLTPAACYRCSRTISRHCNCIAETTLMHVLKHWAPIASERNYSCCVGEFVALIRRMQSDMGLYSSDPLHECHVRSQIGHLRYLRWFAAKNLGVHKLHREGLLLARQGLGEVQWRSQFVLLHQAQRPAAHRITYAARYSSRQFCVKRLGSSTGRIFLFVFVARRPGLLLAR